MHTHTHTQSSKRNLSFLISKYLLLGFFFFKALEICFICQGWMQFLNVSKQLFPSSLFKKRKDLIMEA